MDQGQSSDANSSSSSSSTAKALTEYDLITHCVKDKAPFQTFSENDYICLQTSRVRKARLLQPVLGYNQPPPPTPTPPPITQLVLEHPTCGSQWAQHSAKPLKFTVVVMLIVLLGSFGVGLMLDFIHVKRW
jgi:hypothetical protein